jgi:hypothetical protein
MGAFDMEEKKAQFLAHQVLGKILQELLTPVGVTVLTDFQIMSQAPKGDILILRREGQSEWTPEQRALLPDGVRDSRASHVLLEFKYTESINKTAVRQALGYDTFYQQTQRLPEAQVQTFLLSAKTPLPETVQEFGYTLWEYPGVYTSDNILLRTLPLLVLNELRDAPHNAFVKAFASRGQAKQAALKTLQAVGLQTFPQTIQWLMNLLWRQWTMSTDEMELEISPDELIQLGRQWQQMILAQMSVEERLAGLEPKERLAGLEPKERLAGLEPEERLAGLEPEEVLTHFPVEEIEAYLRKLKGGEQGEE